MVCSIFMLLFLCLLVVIIISIYIYVRNVYSYWRKCDIDYVPPYFPFGNLNFIMRKSIWHFCHELHLNHPKDYIGVFLGLRPVLMVQTPELARCILTKDFEYFHNRSLYSNKSDPFGSLNLFTLKNRIWKEMRHELTPLFTTLRLKNVTELMNLNAVELVKKIQRDFIDNNKPITLKEVFTMYSTDTLSSTVFGVRSSILNDEHSALWLITKYMIKWTFGRGLEFTMIFLLPALASIFRLRMFSETASKYLKKIFHNVITQRQLTRTSNINDQDLVNHLIKLKENYKLPSSGEPELADNIMMAQVFAFIFGSLEPATNTLSFCLHELAYHPEIQEKLYEDVIRALKKSGTDILKYEDLMQVNYISACLYETMRKYPALGYIDRICTKDYKLNDDVIVKEGVPVFVNILAIHYDEKYYPSPNEWRPERFINEDDNEKQINYTFLPFGEGPRYCIGKRFGMMQMRVVLAHLVAAYRFEPGEPYDVELHPYSILTAPQSGGIVKFVRR